MIQNPARSKPMTPTVFVLATVLVVGLAAVPSRAQSVSEPDSLGANWRPQQDEARKAVREGKHIPLDRVLNAIRRQTPGRQLDAGIEQTRDGRTVYRVRWAAADGRRLDYIVDAETGAILTVVGR